MSSALFMGRNLRFCAPVYLSNLNAYPVGAEPGCSDIILNSMPLHLNSEVIVRVEGIVYIF